MSMKSIMYLLVFLQMKPCAVRGFQDNQPQSDNDASINRVSKNKRIGFMETVENAGRKVELKDSVGYTIMNLHYQAEILLKTLRYPESTKSFWDAMEKTHCEQNVNRLSIDSLCQQAGFDESQSAFILDYQKKVWRIDC
ncbi:hypothetical protein LDZ77_14230 [Bacteroides xylanisolvens]|uniref:Uncharacterized protein n=2 Tax=Bacteroides xylanisolvens TaxID=371601 RepID=A0AAW4T1A2_9BACE|nr:hypothetical protein [Bacteroides xylanisolvens]MCA4533581.1 hypothetical protein [Bacteroides xylanisolvens]MCA4551575.1 hypothetical protein [Bacteroides xylanisolvens]MCA4570144.1 hypothetical protein [Bacteroides xylanisolvens]MCA4614519.1 hypothetical protein [Bacteroides xylanisolvens]MCA4632098.1 hypothetical protein [Bacteroides xylanisolvens]